MPLACDARLDGVVSLGIHRSGAAALMQQDLFKSRARAGAIDVAPSTLDVFAAFDRAEAALRQKLRPCGDGIAAVAADEVMLFHEVFGVLCEGALRFARRQGLERWYTGRRRASPVELQMVARSVVRQTYAEGEGIFALLSARRGFIDALLSFFNECREGNATPELFRAFAQWAQARGALDEERSLRMTELSGLLEAYERSLKERGLLDDGHILAVALDALRDPLIPLPPILQRARVRFKDIYDWSPVRVDVVKELAHRLDRLGGGSVEDAVELHLPYDFDRPSIFHYLEPLLRQVESLEGTSMTICWSADEGHDPLDPLGELARRVWASADSAGVSGGSADPAEGLGPGVLQIIEAPGQAREARAVARRVRELLEEGARTDEIVIAPRTVQDSAELCEALDAVAVPWHCQRGLPLASAAPARLMMSLLRLVIENYPRESFVEIVSSRYTRGQTEGVEREVVRLLRGLGVRDDLSSRGSGRSAYEELLEEAVEREERRVTRERALRAAVGSALPQDALPVEEDDAVTALRDLCARILWLREEVEEKIPQGLCSLAERAEGLRALMRALGIDEEARRGVGGMDSGPMGRRLLAATARDHQAVRLLDLVLDELCRGDVAPDDPSASGASPASEEVGISLEAFFEVLNQLMANMSIKVGGSRGGCVRIVPIKHLAGCSAAHVIIPGLNQGVFPSPLRSKPLFMDEDRLAFGRFEKERSRGPARSSFPLQCLPYQPEEQDAPVPARQSEEVLLFYFGLAAARETLTLSYSTLDPAGRQAVRSVFLDEVVRHLGPGVHGAVLRAESLDPVSPVGACAMPWEVVARLQLEAVGDGIRSRGGSDELRDVANELEGHVPALPSVRHATSVERLRHRLSTMGLEMVEQEVAANPLGRYCGDLSAEHGPWLDSVLEFGRDAPLTAGALGDFGTCPQRFYLGRLLHLGRAQIASQDVTALDRHAAMKILLEAAYKGLEASALLPLGGMDAAAQRHAFDVAISAMADALGSLDEVGACAHPRLWAHARQDCEALVEELILREQGLVAHKQVTLPWVFGADPGDGGVRGRKSLEVSLTSGMAVYIAGQIDRVLLGRSIGADKLELVEYGSAMAMSYDRRLEDERRLKTDFSLPLAMLAVADGLVPALRREGAVGGAVVLSARYESLLEGGRRSRPLMAEVGGPDHEGDAVEEAREGVALVVNGLRVGTYPFSTRDCAHCAFKPVCRRGSYPERDR